MRQEEPASLHGTQKQKKGRRDLSKANRRRGIWFSGVQAETSIGPLWCLLSVLSLHFTHKHTNLARTFEGTAPTVSETPAFFKAMAKEIRVGVGGGGFGTP